jgi:hypothetical protein
MGQEKLCLQISNLTGKNFKTGIIPSVKPVHLSGMTYDYST